MQKPTEQFTKAHQEKLLREVSTHNTIIGDKKMKANEFFYTRLILVVTMVIALMASNLQGFSLANANDMSIDDIATTRYFTMVYENPEAGSRVETVLMPITEVGLVGRSLDGKWLSLGAGWIKRSDVRTSSDLATLPVTQSERSFIAITRHLTMVYESPEAGSRVETVLMPVTKVSLLGRSIDGMWLALGSGWIQSSNVRTDSDLVALEILNAAPARNVTVGQ
jgi:hypothetical protein